MSLFKTSLLLVLSCAVMSVQAADWSSKASLPRLSPTPSGELSINFLIPDDVISAFKKGSASDKEKFCSSNSKAAMTGLSAIASGLIPAPDRIYGFNSRMDNYSKVRFARDLDEFMNDFVRVTTQAWVDDDIQKRAIALDALFYWASNNAFLATKTCARNGLLDQGCTEWKRKDGQDQSGKKDWSFVQMHVLKMAYNYYFSLSNFRPTDPKHEIIRGWFSEFFSRNKAPKKVYLGLDGGWYWPAIFVEVHNGNDPTKLIRKLLSGLDKLVLEDGSVKDRTTRGNRALWYHHSAMLEILISLEIARTFGVEIPESLHSRVEKAGHLFIRGYEDHSFMDKWAKVAKNSIFEAGKQEFSAQPLNFLKPNNSWFYIFSYRYPASELTDRLDQIIRSSGNEAVSDPFIGFGLGCVYATAKRVAYPNSVKDEVASLEQPVTKTATELYRTKNSEVKKFEFLSATGRLTTDKDTFLAYKVSVKRPSQDNKNRDFVFRVLIDFDDVTKKQNGEARALRVELPIEEFLDPSATEALGECKKSTVRKKAGSVVAYRLYSGDEVQNSCVLSTMSGVGRSTADRLLRSLPQIFDSPDVTSNDPYRVLAKHSQKLRENL
jgi:hypothetical protein